MGKKENVKSKFLKDLKTFATSLREKISDGNSWTIRGFVDIFKNIYPLPNDTKVLSKLIEVHLYPYIKEFADSNNYDLELEPVEKSL